MALSGAERHPVTPSDAKRKMTPNGVDATIKYFIHPLCIMFVCRAYAPNRFTPFFKISMCFKNQSINH